jgi:hypothetical protein
VDYTPTLRFYSSSQFRDTTDQSVIFSGGASFVDWDYKLSQSYNSSSQPLVETGTQTDEENYDTILGGIYRMNSAMSLDLNLSQKFRYVGATTASEQLTDSKDWLTMDWLDYQYAPTLRGAIGAGFGYTDVKVGADMTYEQVQGRISWQPGRKLTLVFNGGFEDRQFLKSEQSSQFNPIFKLNLLYQIFDQTFISLVAEQTVQASYFAGQTSEVTGFDVGFRQRLLGKFFAAIRQNPGKVIVSAKSCALNAVR